MNRKEYLSEISTYLARFSAEVEHHNSVSEYDINIHAEDVIIPILNILFDLKLINANRIKKNFPAVDLIDTENKISLQVTSTLSKDKINTTIEKYFEHKLNERFDILYFYIPRSPEKKITFTIPKEYKDRIDFDISEHLFTNKNIYERIRALSSLEKVISIYKILRSEFSEVKIKARKPNKTPRKETKSEKLFSNLLKLNFPEKVYIAELAYDKKEELKKLRKRKRRKKISDREITKSALRNIHPDLFCFDWAVYSNSLITFRNLHIKDEPLRDIIDHGTISLESIDYFEGDPDLLNVLKSLLNFSFQQRAYRIGLEWVYDDKIMRFRSPRIAKKMSITWKLNTKPQPRDVIHPIWSKDKEDPHIICFRHLAFSHSFHYFEYTWYISLLPTYSFTTNGRKKSRFSQHYMSGIKREEDNKTVYYHFRFLAHHLKQLNTATTLLKSDDFIEGEYHFTISSPEGLVHPYSIEDENWNPPINKKHSKETNQLNLDF